MDLFDMEKFRLSQHPTSEYTFAEFDSDDDEEEREERQSEMEQEVAETLVKAESRTNDSLPAFLWTPILNDFDDGFLYIKRGSSHINEVVSALMNLPNKFRDYYEYIDALALWNEYKAWIEEEYGSWEGFIEASEEGLTTVPVKIEPQLKKTEGNRALRKVKVALSRFNPDEAASSDEIRDAITRFEDPIELYEDWAEYEKHIKKLNDSAARKNAVQNRIRNMYRVTYRSMDPQMDAITQFLIGDTDPDYSGMMKPKSLADEAMAFHDYDYEDLTIIEGDILNIGRASRSVSIDRPYFIDGTSGIWKKKAEEDEAAFWKALNAAGYDAMGAIDGSSMTKQAKRLAIQKLSEATGEYSERQLKKMKKKRKKAEKNLAARMMADEQIRRELTHNKINFERNDELLSFTMDDILRGDGK